MIIILEGVDCAGKSTLADLLIEKLSKRPNARVDRYHRGAPTGHPLLEYAGPLVDYEPGTEHHVVCDRWHVGESVYPIVYERPTQLTPAVRAWLELFLVSRGALLVYLRRGEDYLRDCAAARDLSPDEAKRQVSALRWFDQFAAQSLLPSIMLEGFDAHQDVREIIYQAQHFELAAQYHRQHVTYLGSRFPTLLFFGDKRGVSQYPEKYGNWPAFAPFPATSGHYLFDTLTSVPLTVPTHGALLSTLAFANANDVDDPREIWVSAGRPKTVALGVDARRKLRDSNVPVVRSAPHPQYWRRFRHHEQSHYLARLFGLREPIDA